MKKFLSVLLAALMLLTLLATSAFGAVAEETAITPTLYTSAAEYLAANKDLHVVYTTVTSGNTSYTADGSTSLDWSTAGFLNIHVQTQINVGEVKDSDGNVTHPAQVEVIAAYEAPTTVKKLVFYNNYWTGRLNNFNVSLSTDGTTWTKMFTIGGLSHAQAERYVEYTIPASYAETKWTHIKIDKTGTGWAQLNGVLTLTDAMPEGTVKTTHYQSTSDVWANAWGGVNAAQINQKGQAESGDSDAIPVYTSVKFDCPTEVTSMKFYLGPQGSRMRVATIYASDDGQTWEKIETTAPGNDPYVANTVYVHTFGTPFTAKYVKVEQAVSLAPWDFSLLRTYVYGTPKHDGSFAKLDDAQHSKTCSCGEVIKEDHSFDKTEETKAPTCTVPGENTLTCTACGATKTAPVEASGHTFDQKVVDAKYLASEATCTAKATYYFSCTCGEKGSDTFEDGEIVHKFQESFESTDESHWHKCENCTATTMSEAHVFGEWTTVTEAGPTTDGSKERTCTTCGYKATETIPATGAETETETVPPTDDKKESGCAGSLISPMAIIAVISMAGVALNKKKK